MLEAYFRVREALDVAFKIEEDPSGIQAILFKVECRLYAEKVYADKINENMTEYRHKVQLASVL